MEEERRIKRPQGGNFSNEERSLFVSLLEKYASVIENKRTDGTSIKEKDVAWSSLTNEFNDINSTKRNIRQLKTFYDNFKRKTKKQIADERIESFRTGGGKTQRIEPEQVCLQLMDILKDQIHPLYSNKDSDAFYQETTVDAISSEESKGAVNEGASTSSEFCFVVVDGDAREFPLAPLGEESSPGPCTNTFQMSVQPNSGTETPLSHSWMKRNRPVKKRETEASKARKRISELAEERNALCKMEKNFVIDKKKENELFELKKAALIAKEAAFMSKKAANITKNEYYLAKLAKLNDS